MLCVDVDVDGVVWGAQGFGVLARRSAVAGEGLGNSTDLPVAQEPGTPVCSQGVIFCDDGMTFAEGHIHHGRIFADNY